MKLPLTNLPLLIVFASICMSNHGIAQFISPIVAERGIAPSGCNLTNMSLAATGNAHIDPSLPTFVVTHGWNPLPNRYRLTTPEAYCRKIRARHGGQVNVLAFHWNSRGQGSPHANVANATQAGHSLGHMLLARGVDPTQTTMIGHSMGTIVIASAAKTMHAQTGMCTQKLTLIDGPKRKLPILVRDLNAIGCADAITNVWAAGMSGLGAPLHCPKVVNIRAPKRIRGRCRHILHPARNNHIDIVLWFYEAHL